nr:DUF3667 domain-containing protein [uncultured Undibacterium sp.]
MSIEISGAGEALAAIVVSDELANQQGKHNKDQNAESHKDCANCGATLTGAYCQNCGQSAHIHRSLLHMIEEVLHGILHFDTKSWRTIPALLYKPGQLTKQYIDGKRTSFVSPLALFLFLIFLMFFIFSLTMNAPSLDGNSDSRADVVKELKAAELSMSQQLAKQAKLKPFSEDAIKLSDEINETRIEIRELQNEIDSIDGKEIGIPALEVSLAQAEKNLSDLKNTQLNFKLSVEDAQNTESSAYMQSLDIAQNVSFAESEVRYFKKQIAAELRAIEKKKAKARKAPEKEATKETNNAADDAANDTAGDAALKSGDKITKSDDVKVKVNYVNSSLFPNLDARIEHAVKNPELTLFKMKKNSSGLAILLLPLSLPFLWMLFAFRRQFVMFDHAVFALYSLSFMCILMSIIAILAKYEYIVIASLLFAFVPPFHMFSQLRNAYSLTKFEALWRTIVLLFIALMSLSFFAVIVTLASV